MAKDNQEIEVKFYLIDSKALEKRLEDIGARLETPRIYEKNLRFDTPQGDLARTGRVLRLRQDRIVRVTYKGPGRLEGGARLREELEYTASDFDTARAVFEGLGYQVAVIYEKYRTSYQLDALEITLDEMPYGVFSEIEGPDGQSIQALAGRLGLKWENRINDSYIMLFDQLRTKQNLQFRDLTFENFKDLHISAEDLGVKAGD